MKSRTGVISYGRARRMIKPFCLSSSRSGSSRASFSRLTSMSGITFRAYLDYLVAQPRVSLQQVHVARFVRAGLGSDDTRCLSLLIIAPLGQVGNERQHERQVIER